MPESLTSLSPVALAGLIVAYLLAASRIAGPLTNVWASLPKPWAAVVPAIVAMLPQLADAFTDVNSWQSFAVSVSSAIALILPGIKPKPPEPPSGTVARNGVVIPPGPLTEQDDEPTPPSLPGAAMRAVTLLVALALLLPGCAGWKPVIRGVNEIAKDLCVAHFGAKSKLSLEDVAKQFCETRDDLAPWLDAILSAKREAAPIAEARRP